MSDTKPRMRRFAGLARARLDELDFQRIDDPRKARGKRWQLGSLLNLLVLAMMAGCKSLAEVEKLSDEMSAPLRRMLGIGRRVADTTLRDLLCRLQPQTLRPALHRLIKAAYRRKALKPQSLPFGMVAMDGKATSIRGCDRDFAQSSRDTKDGLVRTITSALVSAPGRPCIDISPVPARTNEMGHFERALGQLLEAYPGSGRGRLFELISYDAGACSLHNATLIVERGLHYLLALKDAQPSLLLEAQRLLQHREPAQADAWTEDVVGATTVVRRLYLTDEMSGWLDWKHLRTVLRVESETFDRAGNRIEHFNRYFLCSLEVPQLSPQQWLSAVRAHWGVENNNHHTLDTVFEEDDRPWIVADPKAMVVVAVLRRIAYSILTLYRSVTQRGEEQRATPWRDLLRWFAQTLLMTTAEQLRSLRPRRTQHAPS